MFGISSIFKFSTVTLALVSAGLLVTVMIKNKEIDEKKEEITKLMKENSELTVKLDAAFAINQSLNKVINEQNTAIKKLRDEKKKLDASINEAKKESSKLSEGVQAKIQKTLNSEIGPKCSDAIEFLRSKASELNTEKD